MFRSSRDKRGRTSDEDAKKLRARIGGAAARAVSSTTVDELAQAIDCRVVGQHAATRELAGYLVLALRRVSLLCRGVDEGDLPHLDACVIEGPTGTGKTYMVKVAAATLGGIETYVIDGSSITGTGWAGGDIDEHLCAIARLQKEKQCPVIVFIDEADKLVKGDPGASSFDPCSNLLRVIEGSEITDVSYNGSGYTSDRARLDKAGLVFVLAGAFEGIEGKVRERLVKEAGGVGSGFTASPARALEKAGLRAKVVPEDLVEFGLSRELVGRVTTVVHAKALDIEDLIAIVRGGEGTIESRYARMMPPGCSLSIDQSAAENVVKKLSASTRGARGIEAEFSEILGGAVENALRNKNVIGVKVSAASGELVARLERGGLRPEEPVSDLSSEGCGSASECADGPCFDCADEELDNATRRDSLDGCESDDAEDNSAPWVAPAWEKPNPVDDPYDAAVRLRAHAGETAAVDPITFVLKRSCLNTVARSVCDVCLRNAPAADARIERELIISVLVCATTWLVPCGEGINSAVILELLNKAAKGELSSVFRSVYEGRTVDVNVRLAPLARRRKRRGDLSYSGLDGSEDTALGHWLFFKALAGERELELAGDAAARFESAMIRGYVMD